MKTVILGATLLLSGVIGLAILCGAAVCATYTTGSTYFLDLWRLFGVTPIAIGFVLLGVIGIVVALVGILQKK